MSAPQLVADTLCECTHGPARHNGPDGVCTGARCTCVCYRPIIPLDGPRLVPDLAEEKVPFGDLDVLLERARRSGTKQVAATVHRIEALVTALKARMLEEDRRAVVLAEIAKIQSELATARAKLHPPRKSAARQAAVNGKFPCGYPKCSTVAKSAGGRGSHRRAKHGITGGGQ